MSRHFQAIYNSIYAHIIAKLKNGLSPRLTYHGIDHTFDVLEQSQQIAVREGITDDQDIFLLKVAALYHDCGFIFMYAGHEAKGCELAKKELPGFGLTTPHIKKICGMIMATKIPQSPKNKMEEIICDADLDYLGRDDFDSISNSLYNEFLDYGFIKSHEEWMEKQISFFELHDYFTKSSQQLRHPKKMEQLLKLKTNHLPGNP
jgi:uncharacterized protein